MTTSISAVEAWSMMEVKPILYRLGEDYFCCFRGIHLTRNIAIAIMVSLDINFRLSITNLEYLKSESIAATNPNIPIIDDDYTYFYSLRALVLNARHGSTELADYYRENMWDIYKHLMDNENALIVA